ncbi:MAG: response regulator transcription factor [Bacteroidales bacterium]|nr:response regulator transcription factor [Bacteroidales bacterium]
MSNRVIICEASEIITNGLYEIIQSINGFDVVARLDTPEHLSEKILSTDANIVIINPNLLGFTDRNLPSTLVKDYPHLVVIALVTNYMESSSLKGYDGIIEINDPKLKVINKLNQLTQDNDKQEKADDVELSKREIDVLVAVAKGMMNKEIADQMSISIHTVISHRKNITRKTGIKSVSGLTVYALLNNLIDENEVYK